MYENPLFICENSYFGWWQVGITDTLSLKIPQSYQIWWKVCFVRTIVWREKVTKSCGCVAFKISFLVKVFHNMGCWRLSCTCLFYSGNKQKWVPLEIDPPKKERPGKKPPNRERERQIPPRREKQRQERERPHSAREREKEWEQMTDNRADKENKPHEQTNKGKTSLLLFAELPTYKWICP